MLEEKRLLNALQPRRGRQQEEEGEGWWQRGVEKSWDLEKKSAHGQELTLKGDAAIAVRIFAIVDLSGRESGNVLVLHWVQSLRLPLRK